MTDGRVKLADVARVAGVSRAAASRAINGGYGVWDDVRRRVREVADRLGFEPHGVARALATGRASVGSRERIEILVIDPDPQALSAKPGLDAMFAACDVSATGVLQALREAGRRVPDDVAVVGFDGSALAEAADLSSVYMPVEQEAASAIRRLLDPTLPPPARLPTALTVRGSSRC
ncbi:substrate-binding domain-containing protein [Actinoplanes siamensis]|uniref:HTH lacI-type domain-containing protein n=1 Tax=Actinoplanes siamensis TaxID=1223317 RepID=A0A919N3W5_9ACTN|nr:substrate-binding domain-containing protein [Actinoplanes siamensis]GIF03919.1 hypothetical protein Asi03nite_14570 [Actinoplanes siamensis]